MAINEQNDNITPEVINWMHICNNLPLAYQQFKKYVIKEMDIPTLKFGIDEFGIYIEHEKQKANLQPRDLYDFFDLYKIGVFVEPVQPFPSCGFYLQSHKSKKTFEKEVYPNRKLAEKSAFEYAFELLNAVLLRENTKL